MTGVYFKQKSAPKKKHDEVIHNLFPPGCFPLWGDARQSQTAASIRIQLFGVIKARESSHQVLVDAEAL